MTIAYVDGHDMVPVERYSRDLGKPMCPDGRCRTTISYVTEHSRVFRGESVPVMAHYRSLSNEPHSVGCRFNVGASLQRILTMSTLIQTPFRAVALGRNTNFRLDIAMDAIRHAADGTTPNAAKKLVAGRYVPVSASHVLSRCLRSAKAVLALVARVQERSELAEILRIKYNDRNVEWDNFFYDENSAPQLLQRLLSGSIAHPVALAVSARTPFQPDDDPKTHFIRCHYSTLYIPNGMIRTSPEIFGGKKISRKIQRNGWNLIFGIPSLRSDSWKGQRFENITFALSSSHQFCRYNPAPTDD